MPVVQTPWGAWILQVLLHSMVALFLVDGAIGIWRIRDARARFKLRFSVLLIPTVVHPISQLLTPARGSFYFRQDWALLDSLRWFSVRPFDLVSLGALFLGFVFVGTSALFFSQEILPILRERRQVGGRLRTGGREPRLEAMVEELSARLGVPPPKVIVVKSKHPLLMLSGRKEPGILVSRGLVETLGEAELQSALAHELAHVQRRSQGTTLMVFLLRIIGFFNPVSMLAFRRMLQDDEEVCDDITTRITGDPESLRSALSSFLAGPRGKRSPAQTIEDQAHDLLLRDRIRRLERSSGSEAKVSGRLYAVLLTTVVVVCYFVV